ncbi:MAG TPA: YceI family protein [Gaiellales bacterium]|jgi:polyisoprenoid-binding protein YceI
MPIPVGTYRFGPDNSTLQINTSRTGAAAKAGHDLLIHVTDWQGALVLGADAGESRIELDADATSLHVREGTGGMKALEDDDRASIRQTIDEDVLKKQRIIFRSTSVQATDGGLHVQGDLTLVGQTRPVAFDVALSGGAVTAVAVIRQTDFGMKPYSALFGALKVADEVKVTLAGTLAPGN